MTPMPKGPSPATLALDARLHRLWEDRPDLERDVDFAAAAGVSPATVGRWRRRHEIPKAPIGTPYHLPPPPRRGNGQLGDVEERRRKAAYDRHTTWTDAKIARALGLSKKTYGHWRLTRHLPPHTQAGDQRRIDMTAGVGALQALEHTRRLRAYNALRGLASDTEVAEKLGLTRDAFGAWRRRRGLPNPNGGAMPMKARDQLEEEVRRLRAYIETPSSARAAARIGVAKGTFCRWISSKGLPPRGVSGNFLDGIARSDPRGLPRARELLRVAIAQLQQRRATRIVAPVGAPTKPRHLQRHQRMTDARKQIAPAPRRPLKPRQQRSIEGRGPKLVETELRIIAHLRAVGGKSTPREVTRALGYTWPNSVSAYLRHLRRLGHIRYGYRLLELNEAGGDLA